MSALFAGSVLTRNRIPTVTASRKRLQGGWEPRRESRPLPSKPLQVSFQEGPPPAPLSPGKGPTVSPPEQAGEREEEEEGEGGQPHCCIVATVVRGESKAEHGFCQDLPFPLGLT